MVSTLRCGGSLPPYLRMVLVVMRRCFAEITTGLHSSTCTLFTVLATIVNQTSASITVLGVQKLFEINKLTISGGTDGLKIRHH